MRRGGGGQARGGGGAARLESDARAADLPLHERPRGEAGGHQDQPQPAVRRVRPREDQMPHADRAQDGERRERGLVVRIQPTGYQVFPEYDLGRQFETMRLLAKTDVPVPEILWTEDTGDVLGQPFYVMGRVDGLVPSDNPPFFSEGWVHDADPDEQDNRLRDERAVTARLDALLDEHLQQMPPIDVGTELSPEVRRKLEALGYSVSRYDYPPGTHFPPHTHGVDKIDAVLVGEFRISMGGRSVVLKAGDSIQVPCGETHAAEVVGSETVVSLDAVRRR